MPRPMSKMSDPNSWNSARRKPTQPAGKTLRRMWGYLGRHKFLIIASMVCMIVGNICALVSPKLSGWAIDAIGIGSGQADFPKIIRLCLFMVLLYGISGVFTYLGNRLTILLSRRVSYELRRDIFNRLSTLPVGYFDKRQTGDIISVISYDVSTVNISLASDLLSVCTCVFTIGFSLAMMVSILPKLVLVFCVTVPLIMLFARIVSLYIRPLFRKRNMFIGQMNGYAEEMLSGQKTTRAYGREEQIIAGFSQKNRATAAASVKAESWGSVIGSGTNFLNNVSLTAVSIFGALLLLAGQATLGNISAFVQYSRKFAGPIREVGNIFGELQSALAAAERIFSLLDEEPELADGEDAKVLSEAKGDVQMDHVRFGYRPEHIIIKDLSLHAKPGSLVAIVGPTGAGKTTIINLLMRFYDVQQGSIMVDGENIYHLTRNSLRGGFTMVLQETWLFQGTVFENIAYGRENATMDEVVAAAKAAGIHGYIRRLPKGYDTMIIGDGQDISKGQKQMLTIARAMLMDSKMLILDEATSNVDTQTERKIQKAMRELMKDRTCFVIAHRLSTIRHADDILVVQDGNVVEQGTHDALMAQKGFYSKLYHAQFENY